MRAVHIYPVWAGIALADLAVGPLGGFAVTHSKGKSPDGTLAGAVILP